jgi:hypothetical protein
MPLVRKAAIMLAGLAATRRLRKRYEIADWLNARVDWLDAKRRLAALKSRGFANLDAEATRDKLYRSVLADSTADHRRYSFVTRASQGEFAGW